MSWRRIFAAIVNAFNRQPPAPPVPPQPPEPIRPTPGESLTDRWDLELFQLHNAYRSRLGLLPLRHDRELDELANRHSVRMMDAGALFHSANGLRENVAGWSASPDETFGQWTHSSGHRANIINSTITRCGFGVAADSRGRHYWTAIFA